MKSVLSLLAVACLATAVVAQTPARDQSRVTFVGSSILAGTIVVDDDARTPLRNATVHLTRANIEDIRAAATDERGRFRFDALPAGTYRLSASKSAFVAMGYGARRPGMPGDAIVLTDGQVVEARPIALMRGAVIAGRLIGRNGQPVADARVQASQFVVVNGERRRRESASASGSSTTNAHGEYRIFGLVPGEYLVSASSSASGLTTMNEVAPAELAWVRQPAGPAPSPGRPFALAPSMFQGTADPAAATPVVLARGEERLGVDFALQYVPVSRVSGVVTEPDGRPAAGLRVQLIPPMVGPWTATSQSYSTRPDGAFIFSGLAPGQYRIDVQGGRVSTPVSSGASRVTYTLWASADVNLSGQDRSDVALRLQPGVSVTGQLVFKGSTPPPDLTRLQLSLVSTITSGPGTVAPSTRAAADGTFTLDGVVPGTHRLAATAPAAVGVSPAWFARSAMAGAIDIIDVPLMVAPGQSVSGVVVTFVDAPTEIAGRLLDASGNPAPQLYVFVFSKDKAHWTPGSRRVASILASDNGAYAIAGLPPGDYYLCAMTDLDNDLKYDTTYLELLVPAATPIALGEGEKKRQDLRVGRY